MKTGISANRAIVSAFGSFARTGSGAVWAAMVTQDSPR